MQSETAVKQTFVKILEEHKWKLWRFCALYAETPDDRQDLFQEILLNVWKSLPSFKGNSTLATWLYKVALRVSMRVSHKASRRKKHHRSLEGLNLSYADSTPLQAFENEERIKFLRDCLRILNEVDRLIVSLYLEELSYREIGEIVGISENYVAVKVKRIKSKLLTCMETHYEK